MDHLQLYSKTNTSSESTCVQFKMASSFRDWTGLPSDLLDFIVTKFGRLSDYIRFCGVCPQWRKVALESDIGHKNSLVFLKLSRKKLPMLMIKTKKHNNDKRGLYSVLDGVTYNLQLPLPCSRRLFGSSHGWLMYYHESTDVSLFNPLNNSRISLPIFKLDSSLLYPSYYLVKGILSADPILSPNNFTVAVIYGYGVCKLAVYKSGDMHWTFIDLSQHIYCPCMRDIAFHEGYLYSVSDHGKLVKIDTVSLTVKAITPFHKPGNVNYLVESQGYLLLVERHWLRENAYYSKDDKEFDEFEYIRHSRTFKFKVFKLVNEKDSGEWVQIDKIGEQAFFVGGSSSVSVSTVEFPECLSNSIYYTSQFYLELIPYRYCGPNEDSGVFCLEDKSIHSHHILDPSERHMQPPIWFVPKPDLATSA